MPLVTYLNVQPNKLPPSLLESIKEKFEFAITKEEIFDLKENRQNLYQNWYNDWIQDLYKKEKQQWLKIGTNINNLIFINSVFNAFDLLLQSIVDKEDEVQNPNRNEHYRRYANELCIETYGKKLPNTMYTRKELMKIIIECETVIKNNILYKKKPKHNVVQLFV